MDKQHIQNRASWSKSFQCLERISLIDQNFSLQDTPQMSCDSLILRESPSQQDISQSTTTIPKIQQISDPYLDSLFRDITDPTSVVYDFVEPGQKERPKQRVNEQREGSEPPEGQQFADGSSRSSSDYNPEKFQDQSLLYKPLKKKQYAKAPKDDSDRHLSRAEIIKNSFPNVTKKVLKLVIQIFTKHYHNIFGNQQKLKQDFIKLIQKLNASCSKKNAQTQLKDCLEMEDNHKLRMVLRRLVEKVCRKRYMLYAVRRGKMTDFRLYADVKNREILHLWQLLVPSTDA